MTERPWVACPLCGEPAQRSEYGLLCTNMECPSNGGQSSTAIDWKQRFKDQVADNIEAKTKHRAKLSEVMLELDQARQEMIRLREQVRAEESNTRRIKQLNERIENMAVTHAQRVNRMNEEISGLRAIVNGRTRAVIEHMITDLRKAADKLPVLTEDDQTCEGGC